MQRSMGGIGGKFADSDVGIIAFGTIAGGAGARLTGGNFWQGAVTGLVVSGLNQAMHSGDGYNDQEDPPTKAKNTRIRQSGRLDKLAI